MISHTMLNEALRRCGAPYRAEPAFFGAVTLDSRTARPGDIFCAIKGDRVDGHEFVADLMTRGIFCVGTGPIDGAGYARVPDVVGFLAVFARLRRDEEQAKVLALTGSSGKTTTRELAARMLERCGKIVHATRGNLNNHLGLPITLLNTPAGVEYIVLEMGMNHAGEIADLCRIADPDAALITNIGFAHIGYFDSRDALAAAKLEIFEHSRGRVVANIDDPYIAAWIAAHPEREVTTYSTRRPDADLFVSVSDRAIELHGEQSRYSAPLSPLPDFMIDNFAAAAALVIPYVGSPDRLFGALDGIELPPYRGETVRSGGRLFIADCYNANPDSMLRSIENFIRKPLSATEGERYLVLGDMAELGKFSEKFHRELVKYIKTLTIISKSFLIGEEFEKFCRDDIDGERVLFFGSIAELRAALPARGCFLVKGSRRNRLELLFETAGGR